MSMLERLEKAKQKQTNLLFLNHRGKVSPFHFITLKLFCFIKIDDETQIAM